MGSGTYAKQCRTYLNGADIEGVEIDGKITDLAHRYFALDPAVPVAEYDGRAYLAGTDKQYDVIMVDAYQDITIPFQMSSQEFFRQVASHLTENGVMIVNMNMKAANGSSIGDYLLDTIASVCGTVYTAEVPYSAFNMIFMQSPSVIQMITGHPDAVLLP